MLALVHVVHTWYCYLQGSQFILVTDHYPNTSLKTEPTLNKQQVRPSKIHQSYDFKWEYGPGRTSIADPLAHISVEQAMTMGERGCASALCSICRPQASQDVAPRMPRATSSSLA